MIEKKFDSFGQALRRGKYKNNIIQTDYNIVILNFTKRTRGKCTRKELIKKPSPAFVVFAGAQTQLLPLTKREGNKKRKELINLSTYKPIYFQKAAFTLAEVLITLGIIGIVAAMTIPTLIANTRSQQYRSKFKKTVSTLSQAARMNQAQYGYDFSGITKTCGSKGGTEHPDTTQSICAVLNGTLTGATYYPNSTDIKMNKKGKTTTYTIDSEFSKVHGLNTNTTNAYILSDGTIIMLSKSLGTNECNLAIGTQLKDIINMDGKMRFCYGYIDVNGTSLPNKEVSCSSGSNSLAQHTCVVNNDSKHMTDLFPIRIHDGVVEPATAAGRYILHSAK